MEKFDDYNQYTYVFDLEDSLISWKISNYMEEIYI